MPAKPSHTSPFATPGARARNSTRSWSRSPSQEGNTHTSWVTSPTRASPFGPIATSNPWPSSIFAYTARRSGTPPWPASMGGSARLNASVGVGTSASDAVCPFAAAATRKAFTA